MASVTQNSKLKTKNSKLALYNVRMTANRFDALEELEDALGYRFQDRELLDRALRHGSAMAAQEEGSYQRLEFLGDAVLGYAAAKLLFDAFPR
ncbi:MAG: hypothetical protein DRQ45_08715, partial [Gammaproteobacteria bacterium]